MTTPPIYQWPREHRAAAESRFYLRAANLISASPFTGQRSPYGPNAQVWCCDITLPPKLGPEWRWLTALISRQGGVSGLIRLTDYFRMIPGRDVKRAASIGTFDDFTVFGDGTGFAEGLLPATCPVAYAAERGEDSFVLKALPASEARVFRMGDLVEIRPNGIFASHGHLYEAVNDANSDADGFSRIKVAPALRAGIAAGDMAVVRFPHSLFRLSDDGQGAMSRRMTNMAEIGLSFIEELPRE